MKNALLVCLIFFIAKAVNAQNDVSEIERLKRAIAVQNDDSVKVKTLIELGSAYLNVDQKEAIKYGNEARDLAEKINYIKGEGFSYKLIGQCFSKQGKYFEAIIRWSVSI